MKYIRRFFPLAAAGLLLLAACMGDPKPGHKAGEDETEQQEEDAGDDGSGTTAVFAKGADLGWLTEYEDKGYKFYSASGTQMELTALMKSIGFNSVRYRVWVNPSAGYNNKADVLKKCLRAKALGLRVMIDFHYSDTWADPGKQIVPAAWQSYDATAMAKAVGDHTRDVLQTLKDNGVNVAWVQVGNEVRPGMLRHTGTENNPVEISAAVSGKVSGTSTGHFVEYFNAGAEAVKAVYPDASVILHLDNGWDLSTLTWFYDLVGGKGIQYDMIGLSLYPSYWDSGINGYPDWKSKTASCVKNFKSMHDRYAKPVMLVEFGMPASEPDKTKAALQYILDGTKDYSWFQGIFYWEPESEQSRNGYQYGAFSGGKPTAALHPFAD